MAKNSNQKKNKKKNYHEGSYTPRKVEAARDCTYTEGITVKELGEKINRSPISL